MIRMKKKNSLFCAVTFFILFASQLVFAQEKTASMLYDEGLEFQNQENWYQASQLYMEALQKNPVYGDVWFHLAQCSYQLGEYDLVLEQLAQAELYSKDDSSINNLKGMTYIALGNFGDARLIFEGII